MEKFEQKICGEENPKFYSLQDLQEKVDKEQPKPKGENEEIWRFAKEAYGNNYYIASNFGKIKLYTNIGGEQKIKEIVEINDDNI